MRLSDEPEERFTAVVRVADALLRVKNPVPTAAEAAVGSAEGARIA
jgi:hypothetical protein